MATQTMATVTKGQANPARRSVSATVSIKPKPVVPGRRLAPASYAAIPVHPAWPVAPSIRLQRRLLVGDSHDPLETAADAIAERVMRMPEPGTVQRKCSCEDSGTPCAECQKEKLRTKPAGTPAGVIGGFEAPPIVHDVLRSSGEPLDSATRSFFEPRFGADFSAVRVHRNAHAAASASSVNAMAYTVGSNVVFGAGQFSPGTTAGRRLLAHELAHVVQQQSAPACPSRPGPATEILRRQPVSAPVCVLPGSETQTSSPGVNVCKDVTTLSDAELRALYQQLLAASDPDSETYFLEVENELHNRAARASSHQPVQPAAAAAGHTPGGPYHPPEGVRLSCSMADDCSTLSLKINYLEHTIESHEQWDREHPDPAYPGGRHATEIAELRRALENCKEIHHTKCTGQPEYYPVPVPIAIPAEASEGAGAVEATEAVEGVSAATEAVEAAEVVEEGITLIDVLEGLGLAALAL